MPQHELQLPELRRLKPAGGGEEFPEGEEFGRGHRLQNVELGDHRLEDGEDALEGVLGAGQVAFPSSRMR